LAAETAKGTIDVVSLAIRSLMDEHEPMVIL
jgi:hypothetical protein